jgi:LPXTG-motif cell wall-anchored protein
VSLLSHRLRRTLAAGALLALPLALATGAPASAAAKVDPAKIGLYGAADPTYDGVFRQSLAVLAILEGGDQPSDEAVQWLLDQQCADGGFMSFNPTPSKPCLAPDPVNFAGEDTNSTALAVQALLALGRTSQAADAVDFLTDARGSDGGWPYVPGGDSDPNSTGVVLMALSAAGQAVDQDAVDYTAGIQVACSGDPADQGGITTAWSGGAPDVLATVQAVPGVAGLHLVDLPPASDPWADDAPAFTCPVDASDASTVAGWGAAWLEAQAQGGAVTGNNAGWAVLAFASTRTGHDEAEDLYDTWLAGIGPAPKKALQKQGTVGPLAQSAEDPGTLGLAALAGTTLGEDVSALAARVAATETVQATPSPSPTDPADDDGQGGTAADGDALPATGSNPVLVALGAGLVVGGCGLLVLTRRRSHG